MTTTDDRHGYTRVMLKLGGEMFGGGAVGIDPDVVQNVARQIAEVARSGTEVAVVIGGGNFFRGAQLQQRGLDRSRSDYMGMLGTVMNCLALQDFLEQEGVDCRVQTAVNMAQVAEPYLPLRAKRHLEKGRVVIFGAGMGMPYFSTDTTAAQRALEIGCEVLLMAKGVDGVYSDDPRTNPDAELFHSITPRGHREGPQGRRRDGVQPLHGQRHADPRVQPAHRREHRPCRGGRADRHARRAVTPGGPHCRTRPGHW